MKKKYYRNGNIWYEEYTLNGKRHREDGPSWISYYDNGNIEFESHYINGEYYREDGPAIIYYDLNGNIKFKRYYLDKGKLTEQEWFNQLSAENRLKFAFEIEND